MNKSFITLGPAFSEMMFLNFVYGLVESHPFDDK